MAAWLLPATGADKERMNQARVLGEWRYSTLRMPIHKTCALDLKRAHGTAVQLVAPRTSPPDSDKVPLSFPLIHTTPLIREQHFGIAEGKLWLLDRYRKRSNSSSVGVHRRTTTTTRGYWIQMGRSRGTIQYGIGTIGSLVASRLTISRFGRRMRWRGLYGRIWTTRLRLPPPFRCRCRYEYEWGGGRGRWSTMGKWRGRRRSRRRTRVPCRYRQPWAEHLRDGRCHTQAECECRSNRFKGLANTGWTRVRIRPLVSDRWSFVMHCDEFI